MLSLTKQLPDLAILESIPRISEITAVLLLAELGDIRHYESRNFISADHISKRGNSYVNKLLYRAIGNTAFVAQF